MHKKITIMIFLVFLSVSTIPATQAHDGQLIDEGRILGFTIEPSFGYLTGEVREIVYFDSANQTYLSELLWDLDNIFYAGGSVSLNMFNRIFVNTGIWTSINKGNGYMEDYDWLNLLGYDYPTYDEHERSGWTNWSLSSVEVIKSLLFDINTSFDFLKHRDFKLSVTVGYKSVYWDWSDKILDSLYPSGPDVIPVGIDAIDYQLALDIPYFGFGGAFNIKGFFLDGRMIYSPFVFGGDHDHHILTNTHYYDKIILGQYIAASIKSGYRFNRFFSLTGQIVMEYLFEQRGDTSVYNESGIQIASYPGGAGIQYQTISFSINSSISF